MMKISTMISSILSIQPKSFQADGKNKIIPAVISEKGVAE